MFSRIIRAHTICIHCTDLSNTKKCYLRQEQIGGHAEMFCQRADVRSADILVCGFWRLSSRQSVRLSRKHGTRMSREPADKNVCATGSWAGRIVRLQHRGKWSADLCHAEASERRLVRIGTNRRFPANLAESEFGAPGGQCQDEFQRVGTGKL